MPINSDNLNSIHGDLLQNFRFPHEALTFGVLDFFSVNARPHLGDPGYFRKIGCNGRIHPEKSPAVVRLPSLITKAFDFAQAAFLHIEPISPALCLDIEVCTLYARTKRFGKAQVLDAQLQRKTNILHRMDTRPRTRRAGVLKTTGLALKQRQAIADIRRDIHVFYAMDLIRRGQKRVENDLFLSRKTK